MKLVKWDDITDDRVHIPYKIAGSSQPQFPQFLVCLSAVQCLLADCKIQIFSLIILASFWVVLLVGWLLEFFSGFLYTVIKLRVDLDYSILVWSDQTSWLDGWLSSGRGARLQEMTLTALKVRQECSGVSNCSSATAGGELTRSSGWTKLKRFSLRLILFIMLA